jgi:hypothetical protein
VDEAEAIAVVAEHDPGAYGFTMKTPANGLLHRVLPLRDPDQPRLWCVVVVRCSPGGLPDRSEGAWIGARGLRRDELAETLGAIRSDLAAWLAADAQARLREWVLALPSAGSASAVPPAATTAATGSVSIDARSAED